MWTINPGRPKLYQKNQINFLFLVLNLIQRQKYQIQELNRQVLQTIATTTIILIRILIENLNPKIKNQEIINCHQHVLLLLLKNILNNQAFSYNNNKRLF